MLSFDITDRMIRIVKGTASGDKIRVTNATEIELNESIIHNGHVQEINRLVAIISKALTQFTDKEAMISIASNETVFKELSIPVAAKETDFLKNVQLELKNQINVDESFLIGYVKVGQPEKLEGDAEPMQRVLATACPRDVTDAYRRVFGMMKIKLVSVMVSCNAITKVVLADAKNQAKMPLLVVQVSGDSISQNLYEEGTLSFSRFVSIDPESYDDPDDYIYEATVQDIERMSMFARSRGSDDIKNIVFYGDLEASPNLYQRLCDYVRENYEIDAAKLTAPSQVHGSQNLNFSVYANAIGAMFKRGPEERVNLLDSDTTLAAMSQVQDDGTFVPMAVGGIVFSVAVIGIAFGIIAGMDNNYRKQTADYRATIDSPETAAKLAQYDDLQLKKTAVQAYAESINNASTAYKTRPVIDEAIYTAIDEAVETVMNETEHVDQIEYSVNYNEGIFIVPVRAKVAQDDTNQKYPTNLVQYFYDHYGAEAETEDENKFFSKVTYGGYNVIQSSSAETNTVDTQLEFELQLELLPNVAFEVPEEEAPAEDAETPAE